MKDTGKFAKEVIVYLNKDFRVSRNIRLSWYLDHLISQNPLQIDGLDSEADSGLQVHDQLVLPDFSLFNLIYSITRCCIFVLNFARILKVKDI